MGLIVKEDPLVNYISAHYRNKFRKEEELERERRMNIHSSNSSSETGTNRIQIQIENRPEGKVRVQRVVRPDGRSEIIGATLIESSSNNDSNNSYGSSNSNNDYKDKVPKLNVDHLIRGRAGYERRTFL